jgi:hypothetical protein
MHPVRASKALHGSILNFQISYILTLIWIRIRNNDYKKDIFGHLCFRLEDSKKDGHSLGPDLRAAQPQVHFQSLGRHTASLKVHMRENF